VPFLIGDGVLRDHRKEQPPPTGTGEDVAVMLPFCRVKILTPFISNAAKTTQPISAAGTIQRFSCPADFTHGTISGLGLTRRRAFLSLQALVEG